MPDQKIVRDQRGQERPADKERAQQAGLRGGDKRQGALQDAPGDRTQGSPEGLERERKGPVDKRTGRGHADD